MVTKSEMDKNSHKLSVNHPVHRTSSHLGSDKSPRFHNVNLTLEVNRLRDFRWPLHRYNTIDGTQIFDPTSDRIYRSIQGGHPGASDKVMPALSDIAAQSAEAVAH